MKRESSTLQFLLALFYLKLQIFGHMLLQAFGHLILNDFVYVQRYLLLN